MIVQPQPQAHLQQPPPRELTADEQWIAERLRENEGQRQRIESVQALMSKEARSPALEPVRARLKEATALLGDQRERYHARLWGIELLRWSDRLAPLTTAPEITGFDDAMRRRHQVAELTREGEALRSRWQDRKETARHARGPAVPGAAGLAAGALRGHPPADPHPEGHARAARNHPR